ncbi:DUF3995 domain-containing protein [Timonella sp. A28]|uniref:DUF3995 domain-containing protein n=1 Tax=Timonella sp. A28 TaxID=3442640 RepID=UPI003EBBAEE8
MRRHIGKALLAVGGLGLIGLGALHVSWAQGKTWPAKTSRELSEHVTGSPELPSPLACMVVATPLLASGTSSLIQASTGLPDSVSARAVKALPMIAGGALTARGIVGGKIACTVVGLPAPQDEFMRLDTAIYRPLCLTLGLSTIAGLILTK